MTNGLKVSFLLFILMCGCRASGRRVAIDWFDPVEMLFPDDRPLHEQYPADRPISAGKDPG
jgi:hypothetical protein